MGSEFITLSRRVPVRAEIDAAGNTTTDYTGQPSASENVVSMNPEGVFRLQNI